MNELRRLPGPSGVIAFVIVAVALAVTMPLVAYAGSLALFGVPHVLAELLLEVAEGVFDVGALIALALLVVARAPLE